MPRLQLPEQGLLREPACRGAWPQGHPERQEHPRLQGPRRRENHQRRHRRAHPEEPSQAHRHGIRALHLLRPERERPVPGAFAGALPHFPGPATPRQVRIQAEVVHPEHPPHQRRRNSRDAQGDGGPVRHRVLREDALHLRQERRLRVRPRHPREPRRSGTAEQQAGHPQLHRSRTGHGIPRGAHHQEGLPPRRRIRRHIHPRDDEREPPHLRVRAPRPERRHRCHRRPRQHLALFQQGLPARTHDRGQDSRPQDDYRAQREPPHAREGTRLSHGHQDARFKLQPRR